MAMLASRALLVVNVFARLVGATPIVAAAGVDGFICGDDCSPGATAVNLRLCGVSEADVHVLGACFDTIGRNNIKSLDLGGNFFSTLPGNIFDGMVSMTSLHLDLNMLQIVPEEIFEGLHSLEELDLRGNSGLQCVYRGSARLVVVEDQNILSSEACVHNDMHLDGTRACLDSRKEHYRCTGCSNCDVLDLSWCGLTDADICEVETCFMKGSRESHINTINIEGNDFTKSGENLLRDMLTSDANNGMSMPACDGSPATATELDPVPWEEEEEEEDVPVDVWGPDTPGSRQDRLISRNLADVSVGTLGIEYNVKERVNAQDEEETTTTRENAALVPAWDSSSCMHKWGRPELLDTPDPKGYIIFVNGREQLGGNKFLVSDGMFIAKSLGRTLVEYPVRDSRNVGFKDSRDGFSIYWDATELCMYGRILDLARFRAMTLDGRIPAENFVTITSGSNDFSFLRQLKSEHDVKKFFKGYEHKEVIVMERMWKSGIEREALLYLRPNRFLAGVVRMLLQEQEDWGNGGFLAVQWRTERSTGNLTECYTEVKAVIEQQRNALGYGRHQVFMNTDLVGDTSGTYKERNKSGGQALLALVEQDYPAALNNRIHTYTSTITDSGTRAIVAGLATASSDIMLASSLNDKSRKNDPDAYRCQKVHSGYIHLIAEWRVQFMDTSAAGVYRLFPLGDYDV